MKKNIVLARILLMTVLFALPLAGCGKPTTVQAKPYPLNTCLVCDMKFGDTEKPFSFVYEGQEIKVCDKAEMVAFGKDPAKYLKKLADAGAKPKP